jgi:transcriptional regulator with XRE-family HTH domain
MTEIGEWLGQQLQERGWSSSELARRAGISQSSVSNVLTGKQVPGLEFCKGAAQALGMRTEELLSLAGHLPPLPAPVVEEREALRLLRGLSGPMRDVALSLLRALDSSGPVAAGRGTAGRKAGSDGGGEPVPRPRSLTERLALEIAQDLETMPQDDQRRVFDLMKRLRGDRGAGETEHVSLDTDS